MTCIIKKKHAECLNLNSKSRIKHRQGITGNGYASHFGKAGEQLNLPSFTAFRRINEEADLFIGAFTALSIYCLQ